MYIRFVVHDIDDRSFKEKGLFTAMGDLEEKNVLYKYQENLQKEISTWFSKNLIAPKVLSSHRCGKDKEKAISWFKQSAKTHIDQMRAYAQILEAHDILVKQIVTKKPGKIVYEDNYQIAAIPFADTFND